MTTRSTTFISHRETWPPGSTKSIPDKETWPPGQQHIYQTKRRDHQVNNIYTTQRDVTTGVNKIYTRQRDVTTRSTTSIPDKETWPPGQLHLYYTQRRDHQVSKSNSTQRDNTMKSTTSRPHTETLPPSQQHLIPHRETWPPTHQHLSPQRDTWPPSQQHLCHIKRRDHQVSSIIPHREAWPPSQQHLYHTQRRDDQVSSIYTTQSDVTTKSAISNSTQRYGATKSATSIPHREAWPPSQQHLYHIERRDSKVSNIYTNHIDHRVSNIYTTQRDVTTKSATSIPHREAWSPSHHHPYNTERRDHQVINI